MSETPLDVIDLELTIIKADGLAAKDTNIFGETRRVVGRTLSN